MKQLFYSRKQFSLGKNVISIQNSGAFRYNELFLGISWRVNKWFNNDKKRKQENKPYSYDLQIWIYLLPGLSFLTTITIYPNSLKVMHE
ncbi:MAG: hypothetical protein BGO39_02780 [Chloroflexi bacterium 54-19]|nr:MAG: hypothetical protein BGO39_02780 [Chloroflexi bacterium 54-19]